MKAAESNRQLQGKMSRATMAYSWRFLKIQISKSTSGFAAKREQLSESLGLQLCDVIEATVLSSRGYMT